MHSNVRNSHSMYLGQQHFALALACAFLLHVLVLYIIHILPKERPLDIPVRVLNIKLGDGEILPDDEAVPTDSANNNEVENLLSQLVKEPKTESKTPAPAATKAPSARQFIRDTGNKPAQLKPTGGSPGGTTKPNNAQMRNQYGSIIGAWINKFYVYPAEARSQQMEGSTAVRIRIDRRGNILFYSLERSTGFPLLDKAAIEMVRRANPVPAVPNDYSQDELMEFIVPINFTLP